MSSTISLINNLYAKSGVSQSLNRIYQSLVAQSVQPAAPQYNFGPQQAQDSSFQQLLAMLTPSQQPQADSLNIASLLGLGEIGSADTSLAGLDINSLLSLFDATGQSNQSTVAQDEISLENLDINSLLVLLGGLEQPLQNTVPQRQAALDVNAIANMIAGASQNNANMVQQNQFAQENARLLDKLQQSSLLASQVNPNMMMGGYGQPAAFGSNPYAGFRPYGANTFAAAYNPTMMGGYGYTPQMNNAMHGYMPQAYAPQMGYGTYGMMPQQQAYDPSAAMIQGLTGFSPAMLGLNRESGQTALNFGMNLAMSNTIFGLGNPNVRQILGF